MSLRILLLGYERIAGKKVTENSPTLVSAWGFFFFSFLVFFPFFNTITLDSLLLSLISGSIYSLSFVLYTYALKYEDTSVVAPIYNLNVFFLIPLGFIFLGERITVFKILGALLMIYGVSFLKKGENLKLSYLNLLKSKGALAMLVSSILMAFGRIVDKKITSNLSPISYSVSIYLVISTYIFIYGILAKNDLKAYGMLIKNKFVYLILAGICNAYSYVALLNAFKYIDVSIAEPVSMLSTFVTIIFAKFVFKEKVGVRTIGAIALILGAVIIMRG